MPAKQKQTYFEGLIFEVEPVEEPSPVFFTNQSPKFEITISNESSKYEFAEESEFRWTITTSPMQVVYTEEVSFGPLDHGEETKITVGGKVLSYDRHGVFGISVGGASGKKGSRRRRLTPGTKGNSNPTYSYSVWDKSQYEASIRRPQTLQKYLIYTSLALIIFAAVQIGLAALQYISGL